MKILEEGGASFCSPLPNNRRPPSKPFRQLERYLLSYIRIGLTSSSIFQPQHKLPKVSWGNYNAPLPPKKVKLSRHNTLMAIGWHEFDGTKQFQAETEMSWMVEWAEWLFYSWWQPAGDDRSSLITEGANWTRSRAVIGTQDSCVLCHIYQVEIPRIYKQRENTMAWGWCSWQWPFSMCTWVHPLNWYFSCNFSFEPHCFHLNPESSLTHCSSGFLQSDVEQTENLARCHVHKRLHLTLSHSQFLLQSFWSQVKNPAWLSSYKLELLVLSGLMLSEHWVPASRVTSSSAATAPTVESLTAH